MRRSAPVVLILSALSPVACTDGAPDDTGTPPAPNPLTADASWLRDPEGRVVIVRGVNYSGLEFGNFPGAEDGPSASDFAQLASWGVDAIRLPIAWAYLEPSENALDETYLTDVVDPVIGFAAAHGIGVVLDMHQYAWSSCVGGLGVPAWTCEGRGYPTGPVGSGPAACDFFALEGDARPPATASDGRLLREHFLDAWRLVVRHYAADPRVVGWDYFNEPLDLCLELDGRSFEREALHPLYRRMRAITEEEDGVRTWFYEPPVTRNVGTPASPEPFGPDVAYAPHLYDGVSDTTGYDRDVEKLRRDYDQAMAEAAALGGPLVVGEFGGITDGPEDLVATTAAFLRDTYTELDRRLAGGFLWAYFPGGNGYSVVRPDGSEKDGLVDEVARPYAQRVAGTPTSMGFDPATRAFHLTWVDDAVRQPTAPTEIFLPVARHYPEGFTVETTPGDTWELSAEGTTLKVHRGSAAEHEVRVTPAAPR